MSEKACRAWKPKTAQTSDVRIDEQHFHSGYNSEDWSVLQL